MPRRTGLSFSQVDGILPTQKASSQQKGLSGPLISWPEDKEGTRPRCATCDIKIPLGAYYRVREAIVIRGRSTMSVLQMHCANQIACADRRLQARLAASVRQNVNELTFTRSSTLGEPVPWKIQIPGARVPVTSGPSSPA